MVDGHANFARLTRVDIIPQMNALLAGERLAHAISKSPTMLPTMNLNLMAPSFLLSVDSWEFFSAYEGKHGWKNELIVRSIEML